MAIIGSGFDRDVGGATGDMTYAGVPADVWFNMTERERELLQQDYLRTDVQSNYFQNQDTATQLAYVYTGIVDHYTGLESAEVGESTNEFISDAKDRANTALNLGGEFGLILGLGALALVLRK